MLIINQIGAAVFTAIATALIAVIILEPSNNKRAIHSESNWRSELLKLCWIKIITDEDILKLRPLVSPYFKDKQMSDGNILDIDNVIIEFCQTYYQNLFKKDIEKISLEFRVLARTLLKYDWNYSQHKDAEEYNEELLENLQSFLKKEDEKLLKKYSREDMPTV